MPNRRTGKPKNTKKQKAKPSKTIKAQSAKEPVVKEKLVKRSIKLPSVWQLTRTSWLILWKNRRIVSYIMLIYGFAYLILVLGLASPANVTALKQSFNGFYHGNFSSLDTGYHVFTNLLGGGSLSSVDSGFQVFVVIIASLAIIWALRQFYQGLKIKARDSYYQGMYPMVKYVLVLLFVAFQLLPLAIGVGLYNLLITDGIAVSFIERAIVIILTLGLSLLSLYLVASSVIALYIVCLPDVTPMQAIRSAKGLVKGRRWIVARKLIFLPVLLLIVMAVIMLPFIILASGVAGWLFFLLTLVALVYINSYLYSLYRGLIDE